MKRILSLCIAFVMIMSALISCGETSGSNDTDISDTLQTDTPPAISTDTDPVDTSNDETNIYETDASETDTSETDAPDTDAPIVIEPPKTNELVRLDFNTELPLLDYIANTEGVSVNNKLNGGDISDGKWAYSDKALAFSDDCGIYDLDAYNVELDLCFNSLVNKDSTSVFTFITDNDGVLGGDSNFFALKLDMNGSLYINNNKPSAVVIELGKVYNIRFEIDRENEMLELYLDNNFWTSVAYKQKNNVYNCFRFMDNGRGADMWIDNFVVTDTSATTNKSTEKFALAIDGAYVRNGSYADTPQKLAGDTYIDIKHADGAGYYREGLLKFDISALVPGTVKYTTFNGTYVNMGGDRTFDIYWISSDWDGETVTYNNMPLGELIISNVTFGGKGAPLELSSFIEKALAKGDKTFSIRIVPTSQTGDGQTRIDMTGDKKPFIMILDEKPTKNYFEKLSEDEETNAKIWAWAQQMYDEWYARYMALPAVNDNAVMLEPDQTQYTKTNYASGNSGNYNSTKKPYKSRPLDAITDLDEYVGREVKNAKLDEYGGLMVESLKQKSTGYFYTTKIDGRWWMVDPLGYPYFNIGLSLIDYSLNGSALQKENALKKYGSFEQWAISATKEVRDDLNFNSTFSPRTEVRNVENGLPYMTSIGFMSSYGGSKGVRGKGNGSTVFLENNTMPVFDPDFVGYANNFAKDKLTEDNNPRIIGFTSDNELPMDVAMLDNSLTVNHLKAVNFYTYACAWTWLSNITGKDNPSFDDITDELRDLYRGFVYDRYFYVVSNAIEAADSNHMYMGCKFLTKVNQSQWVYRFAAQYLDCMTINWYFCWEPESEALYGIERNGDMPFVVTEFYTKAGDSGLGNTSGAGWYVAKQTDRADFYETFTIKLLESNNCVGWQLFHYMDNDPNSGTTDASSVDSNKGIYNNDYELYTEFTDRITILNDNVYKLLDYFKNK